MAFDKILVEKDIRDHPRTKAIISHFKGLPLHFIDSYRDVFGRVKKPYLQKRSNLSIFIAQKKGQLVKLAPDAYGTPHEQHYYFIHAYNCVYECEYCYLQGHFNSPDLVFFINHEDIGAAITQKAHQHPEGVWFHAGEFSDSLALSHITGELPYYFDLFRSLPWAKLELRTKSVNLKELLNLPPSPNIVVTFGLSPKEAIAQFDHHTPSQAARLGAIQKLHAKGFGLGVHFDPIIWEENYLDQYKALIRSLGQSMELKQVVYVSLGVVRFTKKDFLAFKDHYPKSAILRQELDESADHKVKYPRPTRLKILNTIKKLLIEQKVAAQKIYFCMESENPDALSSKRSLQADQVEANCRPNLVNPSQLNNEVRHGYRPIRSPQ